MTIAKLLSRSQLTGAMLVLTMGPAAFAHEAPKTDRACGPKFESTPDPTRLERLKRHFGDLRAVYRRQRARDGRIPALGSTLGHAAKVLNAFARSDVSGPVSPRLSDRFLKDYFEKVGRVVEEVEAQAKAVGFDATPVTAAVRPSPATTLIANGAIALTIEARGEVTVHTALGDLTVFAEADRCRRSSSTNLRARLGLVLINLLAVDGSFVKETYAVTSIAGPGARRDPFALGRLDLPSVPEIRDSLESPPSARARSPADAVTSAAVPPAIDSGPPSD